MKYIKIFFINILLLTLLSSSGIGQDISAETDQDISAETGQDISTETDQVISTDIGQDVLQIMFINELDRKSVATYGDALRMFKFQTGTSDSYLLNSYQDDSKLTRGMVSLMIARHLKLNKSLMYRLFEIERYAYKECMAEKFFGKPGKENDLMSGPQLIELFGKIDEFKGRR